MCMILFVALVGLCPFFAMLGKGLAEILLALIRKSLKLDNN